MEKNEITTLSELTKELKINKSKLNYYVWLGLLVPIKEVGKTMIFDRKDTIKKIKFINKEKGKGSTLKEVARIINTKGNL